MKKGLLVMSVMALFVIGLTGQARATHVDLLPGSTVAAGAENVPASTLWASVTCPFTGINANNVTKYTGVLHQEVRREIGTNHLIFVYWVENNSSSVNALARISTTDFYGYETEVAYMTNGGINPYQFTRNLAGDVVGFDFPSSSGLPPGTYSNKMWIRTDAYTYTSGSTSIIDGAIANCNTWAPAAGTPEPMTLGLMGLGILGMGVLRKKVRA